MASVCQLWVWERVSEGMTGDSKSKSKAKRERNSEDSETANVADVAENCLYMVQHVSNHVSIAEADSSWPINTID